MTRTLLFAAAMLFCLPLLSGCGGGGENTTVEGNDMAAIEAEEAEAEAEEGEGEGEEPGGLVAPVNTNEP